METLEYYTQQTQFTEPGRHGTALYPDLPGSLEALCSLIKSQLIHPSAVSSFGETLPFGRRSEDGVYSTASEILGGLMRRSSAGLTLERTPAERLILSCRHHAILLTSILRFRGVPARVRVGFCEYVATPESGLWEDHWITEVWHAAESRWMLVDADTCKVDFPRSEFALAGEIWQKSRKSRLDTKLYGSGRFRGVGYVRNNLIHDFDCLIGSEEMYTEGPRLYRLKAKELGPRHYEIFDRLAEETTAETPDTTRLLALKQEYHELQYDY